MLMGALDGDDGVMRAGADGWSEDDDKKDEDASEEGDAWEAEALKPPVGLAHGDGIPKRASTMKTTTMCLPCATCSATSKDVEWYENEERIVKGSHHIVPCGDACMACGLGTEAFPDIDRAEVVKRYHDSPQFRLEFKQVRARAENIKERDIPMAEVFAESKVGIRVETEARLIDADDFLSHFGAPAQSIPNAKLISIMDERGNPDPKQKLLGVLMRDDTAPRTCHRVVA